MKLSTLVLASIFTLATPAAVFAGDAKVPAAAAADIKDMSAYKKLAEEALAQAKAGKLKEAHAITKKLEKAYDKGTKGLKKADAKSWTEIDCQMDLAIEACAGTDATAATTELNKFIEDLAKVK